MDVGLQLLLFNLGEKPEGLFVGSERPAVPGEHGLRARASWLDLVTHPSTSPSDASTARTWYTSIALKKCPSIFLAQVTHPFHLFSVLKKNYLFIYLFMAALGLRCCAWAFSSCGEQGLPFVAVRRLLIAVASLVVEYRL